MKIVDVGLVFQRDHTCDQHVISFIDSYCVGDLNKRWSTTDYVFSLEEAPVSWKSTLQSTVVLSTIEAEYMTLTKAVKEAIWLGGLLDELGFSQKQISIYYDSQSVIYLTNNPVFHVRTKHIDVRYQFVQETIGEGRILLEIAENLIDMLTKVVITIEFNHCLDLINIAKVWLHR